MAQKKITDLQLISAVTDGLNIPGDDGIQTYRATARQFYNYLRPLIRPQSYELTNLQLATSVGANALTIELKNNAGSTPTATDPVRAAFRSATLTNGGYNLREISAALSLVISSGSTLGQTNGQASNIYVYLIDNGGSVELAASHSHYSDDALVTTIAEGGAGAADSATAIYSAVARTNVPLRLIGYITNTQTTAGTWASAGTQIQLTNPLISKAPTVTALTSGSGNYNTPAGCVLLKVKMNGGGGGGSGSSTTAASNGGAGGSGGATTFGTSFLTCNGGNGGVLYVQGGDGGSSTMNAGAAGIALKGGSGSPGNYNATTSGGAGGASAQGGAGCAGGPGSGGSPGTTNSGSGGGGGGSPIPNANSGSGGGAGGWIEAIIVNPLSSYSYAIGAAGTAGIAGTSGFVGGAGGSGSIIIEEFYL